MPSCQVFKPIYAETAEDFKGKAEFYEMDISSSETWHHYDIVSIPVILIFRDRQLKKKLDLLPEKAKVAKALIE